LFNITLIISQHEGKESMASILNLTKERDAHIEQRLRNDITIWLNTIRPDGRPHAVVVWFLWDGEAILIFSQPGKQKLRNIQHNSNVLLAVDNTREGSDPIAIEGIATLLEPGEANAAHPGFVKKYGEHIKQIGYTPEQMAAAYSEPIRIVPTRVM
jgi:PPOX class probable F420-dependent enzyme